MWNTLAWRFGCFERRELGSLVRTWQQDRQHYYNVDGCPARRRPWSEANNISKAKSYIECGEVSRAGRALTNNGMGDPRHPDVISQLQAKHPDRARPIPDAAYGVEVEPALLTLDVTDVLLKLPRKSAPGPSGMRYEYLSCLVGEYAGDDARAAVEAISEVGSLWAQDKLPGWFNRVFASGRLVAANKVPPTSLDDVPDARPVAIGEADRRVFGRVVMKVLAPAYREVLHPQQLAVGVKAGDTILIHGVRLLMEQLGDRAVVVHTDLKNAYNEEWRESIFSTLMRRPALRAAVQPFRAAMSTDAFLVVGGRPGLVTSSEGVQQGDPLSTGAFCLPIHEYVRRADEALRARGGACRFFADDGYLVGLPEDVWPALARLTEDLLQQTGLEMQVSKVEAYSADLQAAQAGAPAGIRWPELDGHHGMTVLNVPVCGSPEYVAAYLRGKAEDIGASIQSVVDKLTGQPPAGRQLYSKSKGVRTVKPPSSRSVSSRRRGVRQFGFLRVVWGSPGYTFESTRDQSTTRTDLTEKQPSRQRKRSNNSQPESTSSNPIAKEGKPILIKLNWKLAN